MVYAMAIDAKENDNGVVYDVVLLTILDVGQNLHRLANGIGTIKPLHDAL